MGRGSHRPRRTKAAPPPVRLLNYGNKLGGPVTLARGGAKCLGGGVKGTLGQESERHGGLQPVWRGDPTLAGEALTDSVLRSGFPDPARPYGGPGSSILPARSLRLAAPG